MDTQPIDMNVTNLLTIKEASVWATSYTGKNVTPSNIAKQKLNEQII